MAGLGRQPVGKVARLSGGRALLQTLALALQLLPAFHVLWVGHDRLDGTDFDALGHGMMADAFGATVGVDEKDLFTRADGVVRTDRQAQVTDDAFFSDQQGHDPSPI
ncbi:conserved hypothetical protein [Burkholderiales bacterium]|nr:conserved hypothetical protein [Burkholderiales bacterium]